MIISYIIKMKIQLILMKPKLICLYCTNSYKEKDQLLEQCMNESNLKKSRMPAFTRRNFPIFFILSYSLNKIIENYSIR